MELEMIPVLVGAILALAFAGYLARYIMRHDPGSDKLKTIAAAIQEGAMDEEVYQTILLLITTVGFPRASAALKWAQNVLAAT